MFDRSFSCPERVQKMMPERMCSFPIYIRSFFLNSSGRITSRYFPLFHTLTMPLRIVSTRKYFSSLTRIPVPQIVSGINASCSFPWSLAVLTSFLNSSLLIERCAASISSLCTFSLFSLKRPISMNTRNWLSATSMEFALLIA